MNPELMNLEITVTERRLLLTALLRLQGGMAAGLMQADIDNLSNRIMDLVPGQNGLHLPVEPNGPQGAALPGSSPRQTQQLPGGVSGGRTQSGDQPQRPAKGSYIPQDRFAAKLSEAQMHNREILEITPVKVERKDYVKGDKTSPRLIVTWEKSTGRGFLRATVWDESLFPWVAGRVKQQTTFHLEHKGQWLNVIGVRA